MKNCFLIYATDRFKVLICCQLSGKCLGHWEFLNDCSKKLRIISYFQSFCDPLGWITLSSVSTFKERADITCLRYVLPMAHSAFSEDGPMKWMTCMVLPSCLTEVSHQAVSTRLVFGNMQELTCPSLLFEPTVHLHIFLMTGNSMKIVLVIKPRIVSSQTFVFKLGKCPQT